MRKDCNIRRKEFILSDELRDKIYKEISEIELIETDLMKINEAIKTSNLANYKGLHNDKFLSKEYIIKIIYIMRFKLEYPTLYIARYLDMKIDMLGKKMKQLKWSYTRVESQQIAANISRDYTTIRIKSKQTMLKTLEKSKPEIMTRERISLELTEKLRDCEIIVGINNLSILNEYSLEVDIPILIYKNNKIFKFAVEFNGSYWHDNFSKNDKQKKEILYNKGYIVFTIIQCNSDKEREQKEVQNVIKQINNIIDSIVVTVNNTVKQKNI